MTDVDSRRMTADADDPFVVFLFGMRVNRAWKLHKWLPVAAVGTTPATGDRESAASRLGEADEGGLPVSPDGERREESLGLD